jgi:hypothetical protein
MDFVILPQSFLFQQIIEEGITSFFDLKGSSLAPLTILVATVGYNPGKPVNSRAMALLTSVVGIPDRRQHMAWKGMPCRIRAHFGFELDEQDKRDFELDRSHGELPE